MFEYLKLAVQDKEESVDFMIKASSPSRILFLVRSAEQVGYF